MKKGIKLSASVRSALRLHLDLWRDTTNNRTGVTAACERLRWDSTHIYRVLKGDSRISTLKLSGLLELAGNDAIMDVLTYGTEEEAAIARITAKKLRSRPKKTSTPAVPIPA